MRIIEVIVVILFILFLVYFENITGTRLNDFIKISAPLLVAVLLSFLGVTATVIIQAQQLTGNNDQERRQKAWWLILEALPQNLCLSLFSFDVWALTTLFSSNDTIAKEYNISGKTDAAILLILVHLVLYMSVLAWGQGKRTTLKNKV